MEMTKELELFRKRRTIRRFTAEEVSEEALQALLEAASVAPSRLDRRPLHYVLIRDKASRTKIAEALRVRPYIEEAPVVIAVCADPAVSTTWELDASAAIENMLLAATAMGLGGAWVGSKGSQLWEQALEVLHTDVGVPAGIAVASLVCIGHPGEQKRAYNRGEKLDPVRVHYDHWDNLKL
jgi:nitroreductase